MEVSSKVKDLDEDEMMKVLRNVLALLMTRELRVMGARIDFWLRGENEKVIIRVKRRGQSRSDQERMVRRGMSDRVKISPVESDGVTCLQTRNLAGSEASPSSRNGRHTEWMALSFASKRLLQRRVMSERSWKEKSTFRGETTITECLWLTSKD